jgi:hypothetical protein
VWTKDLQLKHVSDTVLLTLIFINVFPPAISRYLLRQCVIIHGFFRVTLN